MASVGTSTFLFTDIEGSTALLERLGDGYGDVLVRHLDLISGSVRAAAGRVDHSTGDGVLAVFEDAPAAVAAAVEAQLALTSQTWPAGGEVRVRMGLHSGPVRTVGGELVGIAVHVAARVMAAAHGGQILISGTTAALVPDLAVRDLGAHRLKGVVDEHRLLQVTSPGLPDEFPPPRTIPAMVHNLPTIGTSFVGRADVVRDLVGQLGEDRLTTVVGPPGVGKTRLALEAAEVAAASFADGVWFADLTPTDRPGVLVVVAAAVGLNAPPGEPLAAALANHLAGRSCILVLDNCEHVIAAAADVVASILATAPGVHVLATSRTLLGVAGEHRLDLAPLELPHEDDAGSLASSPAGELLLERALAADPSLVLDDWPALAALCREVDGIPLALELAAARLSDIEPSEVVADLHRSGAAPGRDHRATLAATVAWSAGLLRPSARSVLARLGVFAGAFPLAAAVSVAGTDLLVPEDVPDLLDTLLRRSLVTVEGGPLGRRYRLLRMIRDHATGMLEASGDAAATRQQHAEYWAHATMEWNGSFGGPGERAALDHVTAARSDLLAAFDWALAAHDRLALLLGRHLWYAWASRGPVRDGLERLAASTQIDDDDADLVAANHRGRSVLQYLVGDIEGAYDSLGRAIAAAPSDGELLAARQQRASLASQLGRPDEARAQLAEVVDDLRERNDYVGLIYALAALASTEVRTGLAEASLAHFDEARTLAAAAGDQRSALGCGLGLADARALLGDHAGAIRAFRELLPAAREFGDEYLLMTGLRNLGGSLLSLGDSSAGEALMEARDLCLRMGHDAHAAECAFLMAEHELLQGRPATAFALTTEGLRTRPGTTDSPSFAAGVATRGRALLHAGRPMSALPLLCGAAALQAGAGKVQDAVSADIAEASQSLTADALLKIEHAAHEATLEGVIEAALALTWDETDRPNR